MNNNLGSQIAGEIGQIAKDVGKQVVQIPKDIVGKALESMGASSGKQQGASKFTAQSTGPDTGGKTSAWDRIGAEPNMDIKRHIARKALEELAGGSIKKQREPSIWERLQQEQEQKKQMQSQQQAQAASQSLPMPSSKKSRGDLYGKKAKSTAMENKAIKQD